MLPGYWYWFDSSFRRLFHVPDALLRPFNSLVQVREDIRRVEQLDQLRDPRKAKALKRGRQQLREAFRGENFEPTIMGRGYDLQWLVHSAHWRAIRIIREVTVAYRYLSIPRFQSFLTGYDAVDVDGERPTCGLRVTTWLGNLLAIAELVLVIRRLPSKDYPTERTCFIACIAVRVLLLPLFAQASIFTQLYQSIRRWYRNHKRKERGDAYRWQSIALPIALILVLAAALGAAIWFQKNPLELGGSLTDLKAPAAAAGNVTIGLGAISGSNPSRSEFAGGSPSFWFNPICSQNYSGLSITRALGYALAPYEIGRDNDNYELQM
jgi:hypothetical protein